MAESGDRGSDLLVIFGITGDLARKMTFRALYRLERRELLQCPILGVASDDITKEELVKRARKAIADSGEKLNGNRYCAAPDTVSTSAIVISPFRLRTAAATEGLPLTNFG